MKNSSHFLLICFVYLVLSACAKDNDFKMTNADFAQRSVPLVAYSIALDSAVLMHSTDARLLLMAKRRLEFYSGYLHHLEGLNPSLVTTTLFSSLEQENISNIQHASETQMRAVLSAFLVSADQDLIGVHVLAEGPVGLKDAALRLWASVQLKVFISDLNESQNL